MKKFTILWTFSLVGLVTGLTILGLQYKKVLEYKTLEQEMVKVAKVYVGDGQITIKKNKTKKIDLDTLLKYKKALNEVMVKDCDGYVKVNKTLGIKKYKAIIKCKNYET